MHHGKSGSVRANDEFVVLLDVTDVSLSVCNWSNSVVHDICLLGARFCRHHANTYGVNTQHLICDQLWVDFVCRFLFFNVYIYGVLCDRQAHRTLTIGCAYASLSGH